MAKTLMTQPERGFEISEFEQRVSRLQQVMAEKAIGAVFFSTEAEFRYFSGFFSPFWLSPTRPWFLVVPAEGKPVAVIPSIGEKALQKTWLDDIRCWVSPCPEDEGISLLALTLREALRPAQRIGTMLGAATHQRMPASDFSALSDKLEPYPLLDISQEVHKIRALKSKAEIAKIAFACQVAGEAFSGLRDVLHRDMSEREACRWLALRMIERGIDDCPYLVSASGQGGYGSIISPPTDKRFESGDILVIDTGSTFDGYFCDFDRNYAFAPLSPDVQRAHEALYQAVESALMRARAGCTTGALWQAMAESLQSRGYDVGSVGRMGHGLGMQLTEWPSIVKSGQDRLESGMVITLEPSLNLGAELMLVHEENLVITDEGADLLTPRVWTDLPLIT